MCNRILLIFSLILQTFSFSFLVFRRLISLVAWPIVAKLSQLITTLGLFPSQKNDGGTKYKQHTLFCSIFAPRCSEERGYACRLSVRLSVTFRYRDRISWHTSKISSQLKVPAYTDPNMGDLLQRNTPKFGWNRVGSGPQKPAISPKRCKIGLRLL